MKKFKGEKTKISLQESIIEKILRTGGYVFPLTDSEFKEFERIFGTTDVILPPELNEPTFLYAKQKKKSKNIIKKNNNGNFAMAAREGLVSLPKEIQQQIIKDIKTAEAKKKKRKNR